MAPPRKKATPKKRTLQAVKPADGLTKIVEETTSSLAKRHAKDGRFDLVEEDYAYLGRYYQRQGLT